MFEIINGYFLCDLQYPQKSSLPDVLTDNRNPVGSNTKTGEFQYRCPECPYVFQKLCNLNTHLHQIHRQQRPHSPVGEASEHSITIENGLDGKVDFRNVVTCAFDVSNRIRFEYSNYVTT